VHDMVHDWHAHDMVLISTEIYTRTCCASQVHDWHAAAAPMLYWEAYNQSGGLWRPRLVMTIHNLGKGLDYLVVTIHSLGKGH